MTKQTPVVDVSSFTTDAKFRTWGLAMSTAMQASGLVKTSDTGQIDWATVSKPTAISTQAGYEIYRFADTLQATKPIFMRIGYGSGGVASGNSPSTWVTGGTGSDGAGNITGPNTGAIAGYAVSGTVSNTTFTGYFTNTSNGYCLMNFGQGLVAAAGSNAGFFIVSRTVHPTTGAATGDGVTLYRNYYTSGAAHAQYGLNFNTGTAYTSGVSPLVTLVSQNVSIATAGSVPLGKAYTSLGNLYSSSAVLGYYSGDVTTMSTFTAAPFGTTHTYLAWGPTYLPAFHQATASNNTGATIWED